MPTKDHYQILGLKSSATEKEIDHAYRQLSLKYHPDKNLDFNNINENIKNKYFDIQEAHEILSSPSKRKEYDYSYNDQKNYSSQDQVNFKTKVKLYKMLKEKNVDKLDLQEIEKLINLIHDINNNDSLFVYSSSYIMETFLTRAAYMGYSEVITLLLAKGADIHATNCNGRTALHNAVRSGNFESVKILLNYEANVHAIDLYGNTVFSFSVGFPKIAELLLERGADIQETRENVQQPLSIAASDKGGSKVMEILLDRGVDIEAVDKNGQTALHKAASLPAVENAKILLDKGANIEAIDKDNQTVLHITVRSYVFGEGRKIIKLFIERGADIESVDKDGYTPLHLAIARYGYRYDHLITKYENTEVVRVFLTLGANSNVEYSKFSSTATEIELYNKNPIKYILKNSEDTKLALYALKNLESQAHLSIFLPKILKAQDCLMAQAESVIDNLNSICGEDGSYYTNLE